jgi:prophage tail gpP-like protein
MAKVSELAVLEINGKLYQDWETVSVVHQKQKNPFFSYRFTCSEAMPLAKNFGVLQIKPGDTCQVTLAGQQAVFGYVNTRQVFYDSKRHYVEIQGSSSVAGLAYSSAISKTMESKNVTAEQYIKSLLKPVGINLKVEGGQLPQTKFDRLSIAHGTTILEAIEHPLRMLGNFPLTSNTKGDLVVSAGTTGKGGDFVEGKNILEGREIIYNEGMATHIYPVAQNPGTDKKSMVQVASAPFLKQNFDGLGLISRFLPAVIPTELPAQAKTQLASRASTDNSLMNGDRVTLFITVQGWLNPSGKLWDIQGTYSVKSPMLLMKGDEKLQAYAITFSQDNERGSRTLLELRNDAAMFGAVPTTGGDNTSTSDGNLQSGQEGGVHT